VIAHPGSRAATFLIEPSDSTMTPTSEPTATAAVPPPAQVVRAYITISGLFTLSASVIWGVNTLFLLDAGLDIFEVFVANAAFTAGMVVFEIPTGVVAETSGRRRSFLLSAFTLLVGTLGYVGIAAAGGGLVPFVIASIVLGLGFSLYSGAVEAWLVDALDASGYRGQLDRVFARGAMASGAAELVGSVGGGLLGSVDLAWPFLVRAGLLAAVFVVGSATMHDIGFTPHATTVSALPREMNRVLQASLNFGWRSGSVRLLLVVSLVHGGFLIWAFYAWQPYVLDLLGHDAVWVAGVVAALIALATIAGNALVDFFTRFCGKRTTLLVASSGVFAIAAAGVGVVDSFGPAVVLFLIAMGAIGVLTPVQQAYLHAVVPSAERATVVSFVSLVGSAGGIGGSLGLGYLSRVRSIPTGYISGGLAMLLALPPLLLLRRRREPADVIVGRRAGANAPCAAQGLPPVSGLDTITRQPEPVG
jgi:MFS family permease